MAHILVLHHTPSARARIHRAINLERAGGAHHELTWVADWTALREEAVRTACGVCIVDPYLPGAPAAVELPRLIARYPSLGVLVYGDFSGRSADEMLGLFSLGVRAAITLDHDDDPWQIQRALLRAINGRLLSVVLDRLDGIAPPQIRLLISRLLGWAEYPLNPEAVAERFGWNRRTLERHLRDVDLPPPSQLIVWCRLVNAACLLEDSGRSVQNVATSLQFASGVALSKAFRRYTGMGPRQLMRNGGVHRLCDILVTPRHRQLLASRAE